MRIKAGKEMVAQWFSVTWCDNWFTCRTDKFSNMRVCRIFALLLKLLFACAFSGSEPLPILVKAAGTERNKFEVLNLETRM